MRLGYVRKRPIETGWLLVGAAFGALIERQTGFERWELDALFYGGLALILVGNWLKRRSEVVA